MREWLARFRDWLRRATLDAELDEELAFHRAQLERDALAAGATAEEATWAARRRIGSTVRVKREARSRWSIPTLDQFLHDVRYALRGLRASPGFTAGVVVTLGLGLGANTAMFGVVDRLLFRAPPLLREPGTAHRVYAFRMRRGTEELGGAEQYARYRDIARLTHSFSAVAGYTTDDLAVGSGEEAREMRVGVVSPSFFGFFDAPPVLGRYFTETESTPPGAAPLVVLSHAMWQTRYGGRPDVVGSTLQVGSAAYTVIGVAPRDFVGLWEDRRPALFVSLASYREAESGSSVKSWWTTYSWGWMSTMVRRKPGVTIAEANADLTNAMVRSYQAELEEDPGQSLAVTRPRAVVGSILEQRGPAASSDAKVATWVAGVSVIVLLIACANVANLLVARALRRRREIALRLALGATRRRLLGQLLTESMLLAALGCVVGLGVAQWGGAVLRTYLLDGSEARAGIHDARTVWFAVAAAIVVGLVTGLAPLMQTGRTELTADLRSGARDGARRSRTRTALLVCQGALSAALLVGAGLFVRSLQHVEGFRLGYDTDPVLLVNGNMRGVTLDSARMVALRLRLADAARTVSGVESASLQSAVPFYNSRGQRLFVEGIDSVARIGRFPFSAVSPEHFATLGTRLLRGRGISHEDTPTGPLVMVVSDAMARALWPGEDPIGRCVRLRVETAPCTWVVGVTENVQEEELGQDPGYYYYLSAAQNRPQSGGLFVRTRGDAERFRETVRARLQREMPGDAYVTVTPFADIVGRQKRAWRLGATMFAAFGALALVIAAVGLYSVIAYDVTQRAHELSVRVALGARARDVIHVVVAQGFRFATLGIVLGMGVALLGARWLQPLLFRQSAIDPSVYVGVGVVLLAVAAAACAAPARRATRVDPMVALRAE